MKPLWLLIGCLFLLAACTGSAYRDEAGYPLWERVDSLLPVRADSARQLLLQVRVDSLQEEGVKARYALLRTEADIRCGQPLADDSLIRSAVEYYDRAGNAGMQARAHYWAGNTYRRLKEEENALRQYWKAEELAREAEDKQLLGAIYNNWAYLYIMQGLMERADSLYLLAGRIGKQLPDSILWAETLCRRGTIYINQSKKQYDTAKNLLTKAYTIGVKSQNKQLQRIALNLLSTLYGRMHNNERALETAKQYFALQEDTLHCYAAFRLLGVAYYRNRQYDLATYYLERALPTSDYKARINIFHFLSDVALKTGKLELARRMERMASSCKDSLLRDETSRNLIEIESQVALDNSERHHSKCLFTSVGLVLLMGLAGIIVVFILFSLYSHRWCKEKKALILLKNKSVEKVHKMSVQLKETQALLDESQACQKEKDLQMASLRGKLRVCEEKEQREYVAMQQEEFECQPVFLKIKRIIADYSRYEKSDEIMSEADWLQWEEVANRRWAQVCLKLRGYGLNNVEVRLCSLLLTHVPVSRLVCLFGRKRNFWYITRRNIWDNKLSSEFETCSTLEEALNMLVAENK